ncbi:MAG: FimV/HubP family polar landmark protein, partial [Thermomonas sp.]
GEGTMLQQQLQQRDEDLAARKAEISDLKERVAELEKLKQDQAQLLTMKDSELAAAQQRLADARIAANTVAAKPAAQAVAPVTQTAQTVQPASQPPPQASHAMPWIWGGLAFVGLSLLGWLFSRRRKGPVAPVARRGFDSEALAASMRVSSLAAPLAPVSTETEEEAIAELQDVPPAAVVEDVEHGIDLTGLPTTAAAHIEAPTWHSGRWVKSGIETDGTMPVQTAAVATAPSFVQPVGRPVDAAPEPASAEQRMKLARAFLDIGDDHSAKQLLRELMDGPDPAMRTDAAKMLRELG